MCINSSELKGFLTGLIFGDGTIDKGVTKRSFRIKSIYQDFIESICMELASTTNFKMALRYWPAQEKDGVVHKEYWELSILAHPYFNKKYHHFYDDERHRVASRYTMQWLTPRGLAYWYMCDGYVCLVGKTKGIVRTRRIDICTDRYSKSTVIAFSKMLLDKFQIHSSVLKRNNRYRIRILTGSYARFLDLVTPYVWPIQSMRYKLYLGYEVKPDWMTDQQWDLQNELRSAIALTGQAEG